MRAIPFAVAAALAAAVFGVSSVHSQSRTAWPSFRGPNASGVLDGARLPDSWDVTTGRNIRWRVAVPGLAHSSPIVWGDRIFITTAISSKGDTSFKPGQYGEGTASQDTSSQKWLMMAINRRTGKTIWQRVANEGVPKQKRHVKSTYASSTPATNGQVVVAFFGSMGLYAFDLSGKLLWQRDLGRIDAGAYDLPEHEWGAASSPILYRDLVIVQCDQQKGSFITAFEARTGDVVWKTMREELPSWGTPTVYESGQKGRAPELVTNASNFIRGYNPLTGKELWRLGGSSKITAPTPVYVDDYILVASGRREEKPIFVLRPGARGDITLRAGQTSNGFVVWSKRGRGPYMPTPLLYDSLAYVLTDEGMFDAYDLATGAEVYRQRIPHNGSGFSASPVASDRRIFLASEDGDIFIIKAGHTFELLGRVPMGEPLMATPAIVEDAMYVRGHHYLVAISAR